MHDTATPAQSTCYYILATVQRCLRHRAPRYLADYCVPVCEVAGCQHLRSARCHQLSVPRVCRSTFGARAFSVAGPRVWNSLPDHLRDPAVDPEQFRRDLKTYLFAGFEVLRNRALQIDIYLLTYLLSTMRCVCAVTTETSTGAWVTGCSASLTAAVQSCPPS